MEELCEWSTSHLTTPTCSSGNSGLSGPGAILFTSLISTLLEAQNNLGDPSIYPEDTTSLFPEYDFIVIGSGSAGSVVSSRLSEVEHWNVLLIEAGDDPPRTTDVPPLLFAFQKTDIDWQYKTEPENINCLAYEEQRCNWPRGKVLGGTSCINGMLYLRGHRCDYDRWSDNGNLGWSYDEVQKYFKKFEDFRSETKGRNDLYNTGGYLTIQERSKLSPLMDSILNSVVELGYPAVKDHNNGEEPIGVGVVYRNVRNGTRCSAAKAFLSPAKGRRNFHIVKNAHVTKILINPETKGVYGVQFQKQGRKVLEEVKVSKEVVISAGAVNSPHLLMLSGIGPRAHLEEKGINPIIQDLNVGENLQDHIMFPGLIVQVDNEKPTSSNAASLDSVYQFLIHHSGPLTEGDVTTITTYIDTDTPIGKGNTFTCPNVQIFNFKFDRNSPETMEILINAFGFSKEIAEQFQKANKESDFILMVPAIMLPKSKGNLKLRSADPFEKPLIYPGYFSNEDDIETQVKAIEFIVKLIKTEALQKHGSKLFHLKISACEHLIYNTREYWRCAVPQLSTTAYHMMGSCKMGPDPTSGAVVNPELKVHGIEGLRIADASIIPEQISTPPNAACMMIGQRCADFIKKDWRSK